MAWFSRKTGKHWLDIMDFLAPLVPLGLAAGHVRHCMAIGDDPQITQNLGTVYVKLIPVDKRKRDQYAVMADAPWLASSTPRPRPSCSTAALLIAYGMAPAPLM